MVSKSDIRDVLLSVNWALASFFLVKLTPFELVSGSILKNLGGIALFATFVICFELVGKELIWRVVGKHHRFGNQIFTLLAMLLILAAVFTMVA